MGTQERQPRTRKTAVKPGEPVEDAGKRVREPMPAARRNAEVDRTVLAYPDGGVNPAAVLSERRKIPSGFGAVVRGVPIITADTTEITYVVQLGRIRHKPLENLSLAERNLGFGQADRFEVLEGKHKGPVLVVPLSLVDKKYFIYIKFKGNKKPSENDKATLMLADRQGRVPRTATIPARDIMDHGFDLDPTNPNNEGKDLNKDLVRLFYDFEMGQGRFASEQAGSSPRRRLRDMASSGVPGIGVVESTREAEHIVLLDKFSRLATALGRQDLVRALNQHLAKYVDGDSDTKRRMEASLASQFDRLLARGHEQIIASIATFGRDLGHPEAEVYHDLESQRVEFERTKNERKFGLIFSLIKRKQELAVANLDNYLGFWNTLFPVGPKGHALQKDIEAANGDLDALAAISEKLRKRIKETIYTRTQTYSEEWAISSVDLGMSADEASQTVNMYMSQTLSGALSERVEALRLLWVRANAKLLASFYLNLRLRDLMIIPEDRHTTQGLRDEYDKASFLEEKIAIARNLHGEVIVLSDTLKKVYRRNLREAMDAAGISKTIDNVMKDFDELSLKDQIQMMVEGRAPTV